MISAQQIEQVGLMSAQQALSRQLVDGLRQQFPDIHFTWCMDDDVVAAQPVYEAEGFNLYLIDSRNHCLAFTQDPDIATGIVVAELEDE